MKPEASHYQPYYCEENIWQLMEQGFVSKNSSVVFISNQHKTIAMAGQRAGDEAGIVVWDYHVVLISDEATPQVWDWDTLAPTPCDSLQWFNLSFRPFMDPQAGRPEYPAALAHLAPNFRLVDGRAYLANFASDRRHMLDEKGQWLNPPPLWPPIGTGHTLEHYLDFSDPAPGKITDLEGLKHFITAER